MGVTKVALMQDFCTTELYIWPITDSFFSFSCRYSKPLNIYVSLRSLDETNTPFDVYTGCVLKPSVCLLIIAHYKSFYCQQPLRQCSQSFLLLFFLTLWAYFVNISLYGPTTGTRLNSMLKVYKRVCFHVCHVLSASANWSCVSLHLPKVRRTFWHFSKHL